jgi:hypothetical protein
MQTHRSGRIRTLSALALLLVMSGGSALAQAGSSGMPDGGGGSSGASKFLEMKVSVDATGERLVVVIPKLLKSVGAEFSIDADVKNALLSSHLSNVKLQTVLDVLLRTSDIPVQYTLEKGVYHFSKRVEPPPEASPTKPLLPNEPILPPPPTIAQGDVDVHNVQTYDLLRVLNGLFGIPVAIDPTGDGSASRPSQSSGYGSLGQGSISTGGSQSGNSIGTRRGNQNGNQNGSGGAVMNIFGHYIRLNNQPGNSGNNPLP